MVISAIWHSRIDCLRLYISWTSCHRWNCFQMLCRSRARVRTRVATKTRTTVRNRSRIGTRIRARIWNLFRTKITDMTIQFTDLLYMTSHIPPLIASMKSFSICPPWKVSRVIPLSFRKQSSYNQEGFYSLVGLVYMSLYFVHYIY